MTSNQKQRLIKIGMLVTGLGFSVALLMFALNKNINWFYKPSDVVKEQPLYRTIRLGGMVVQNSVQKEGLNTQFKVTDFEEEIAVSFHGVLPDLFREGQGVVVTGQLSKDNHFQATEVLAKHDENYMPPELKDIQKRAG